MRYKLTESYIQKRSKFPKTRIILLLIFVSGFTGLIGWNEPYFMLAMFGIVSISMVFALWKERNIRQNWMKAAHDYFIEVSENEIVVFDVDGEQKIPVRSLYKIFVKFNRKEIILVGGKSIPISGYERMDELLEELKDFKRRNGI